MSTGTETFQLSLEEAEAYEARFVPALFADWAAYVVDAAGVAPGQDVLDVACGTGIVARTAAEGLDGAGRIVGVDLNEAMLTVARRIRGDLEWVQGDAGALPFPDDAFDLVLCQSALMFFPDRAAALAEMARVVVPDGAVVVQVWGDLGAQPFYGPFVEIAARHAGPEAVELLGSYWALGDLELLGSLCAAADLEPVETRTRTGTVRFPSVEAAVRTEVESTPLVERLDDEAYGWIIADCERELAGFHAGDGVEAPIVGHVVVARRR